MLSIILLIILYHCIIDITNNFINVTSIILNNCQYQYYCYITILLVSLSILLMLFSIIILITRVANIYWAWTWRCSKENLCIIPLILAFPSHPNKSKSQQSACCVWWIMTPQRRLHPKPQNLISKRVVDWSSSSEDQGGSRSCRVFSRL